MHVYIKLDGFIKSEDLWKIPTLFIIHEDFLCDVFLPEAIGI
jgi:hypothetical protein